MLVRLALSGALLALVSRAMAKEAGPFGPLQARFASDVQPLLKSFCLDCHASEVKEGELDLERFGSLADVRRDPATWQKVAEFLDNGEMPPEGSPQLSREQKGTLQGWLGEYLVAEAHANAGDPGPVVLRRLNNAEYTYTIRDLTGVPLDPAREFPVDGAAGEGFTNTGLALAMSPALAEKYFAAAREIAEHAVLLPNGISFSERTTPRDWTNERLFEIQEIYRRHTSGNRDVASLDRWASPNPLAATDEDGRVDLAPYVSALLRHRDTLQQGNADLSELARTEGLNPKYFGLLAEMLTGEPGESLLLDHLRHRWRQASPEESAALQAEIEAWQRALWRFEGVGHLGFIRPWQNPVAPVSESREFRVKLADAPPGKDLAVHLTAGSAGGLGDGARIEWRDARFERPDAAAIPLRDVRGQFANAALGVDPGRFSADGTVLTSPAPEIVAISLPPELAGAEFVVTAKLAADSDDGATVQPLVSLEPPASTDALLPGAAFLARPTSPATRLLHKSFDDFRRLFPRAMCYARIVPVDEVVTLVLFHREDEHLARLMLSEDEAARLDRLWAELFFVSEAALRTEVALEQILEFATQDADPRRFDPVREPIAAAARSHRETRLAAEPRHVAWIIDFANEAWRRPATEPESNELRNLYDALRAESLPHDEGIRLLLARVLTSPAFLYRLEIPAEGAERSPVSSRELATRLSYFLWSTCPDESLRGAAADSSLTDPDELLRHTRRMLQDDRIRRLAIEFACQWLHIRNFDQHDEKSEQAFPEFAGLRDDMYEESVRFFTDLFQHDRSILTLLDAEHTFLNGPLARHYGIEGVDGAEWRRVEGLGASHRGGILTQATFLAAQSGASRTSPILRGVWISETLLNERLPRPPKDVPLLPDAPPEGLTERELIEQHSAIEGCAKCHRKIDPYGFALENFDAIGRWRTTDSGGEPLDVRATLPDGVELNSVEGLQRYLFTTRRDDVVRQFCRKLLGYALGRGVLISDEPLLDEMQRRLAEEEYRFSAAVETIVLSDQFRTLRGRDDLRAAAEAEAEDH